MSEYSEYDVLVIGGGPGGYVAAIRCAQLGLKTACVDRRVDEAGRPVLGGTCLNVGCIPSKALLDSSHHYEFIRHQAAEHGIAVGDARLDLAAMHRRKDKVVEALTAGIASLFRKHKVRWLPGHGRLMPDRRVEVRSVVEAGKTELVAARHLVIATGSTPAVLPRAPVDGRLIVDSTGALAFREVPRRLAVIGAGAIGLELGSVWRRLGSEVVILEALSDFLPAVDRGIAAEALKVLARQGLDIRLGVEVIETVRGEDTVAVRYQDKAGLHELVVDRAVVAVGRRPCTDGLDAEGAGLKLDARGFVEVDGECRTNLPGVWAIGDVVRGPMLAHKAYEEGVAVAERIAGQKPHLRLDTVPAVIYTWPEIAWVGRSEAQLRAAGAEVRCGVFPLLASGRARAMGQTAGLVKVIADARSDEILGVHVLAPHASELVAEAVLAMEFRASSEDLARTIHAHPTLAEALHEAALAADGRPLHV